MPSLSRFTALGNVIGSYYLEGQYDFVQGTNQYDALELLANSDPDLVPVPVDPNNDDYFLLQRFVLVLLYFYTYGGMWTEGRWLLDEADSLTCNWSGVDCATSYVEGLERTYNTVKTEPVIYMRSSLTAISSLPKQPFRKPSY
jgi:hypothetical protein